MLVSYLGNICCKLVQRFIFTIHPYPRDLKLVNKFLLSSAFLHPINSWNVTVNSYSSLKQRCDVLPVKPLIFCPRGLHFKSLPAWYNLIVKHYFLPFVPKLSSNPWFLSIKALNCWLMKYRTRSLLVNPNVKNKHLRSAN